MKNSSLNGDLSQYEIFPWNKNFDTGVALIDEQHKKLVQLLNQLASHLAYQSDIPTLNAVFKELSDYACYHFATEEAIWHEFFTGDALEDAHKAIHNNFILQVQALQKNGHDTEQTIEEVLSFLTHWLVFHILDSDKRMAKAVLAMQAGMSMAQAKQQSENEMTGAMKVLIESILSMYDSLSQRTLQLMKEMVEKQRFEAKQRLATNVFENTLDAICITDPEFKIIDANPAFYYSSQYTPEEVIGTHIKQLKSGLAEDKTATQLWKSLEKQGAWSGKIFSRNKEGELNAEWLTLSCTKNEAGLIGNYVAVFSNISHFIQQQHDLEHLAHHDILTNLPNRLLLFDRLEVALLHAKRQQRLLAICYLDLDGFKPINDNFGHIVGDTVLKTIAKRLLDSVRSHDTVARLGGDEFIILFGDLEKVGNCHRLLNRVLREVAKPILFDNRQVMVGVSIGVTLFPMDESEPELLIHHADQAMYQAKKSGKSRYCFYH